MRSKSCATAPSPAFGEGALGKKGYVMFCRVVGGEIGRDEEVGGVVG